jgi:malate dehydrogenase
VSRAKVSVIGAGHTGATTALFLVQRDLADVVLVDIPQTGSMPKGKALDVQEAAPVLGFEVRIEGTTEYGPTAGSDLVIITAGLPRKPGMSRSDLLNTNARIVAEVTRLALEQSPQATIIVLTNPLDAMCTVARHVSGLPRERVFGQAGILDSARMRTFMALEAGVAFGDTSAFVLGGHGDEMVPLARYSTIGGIPMTVLFDQVTVDRIVQRTRTGGGEIVELLGTGSAYYAPAAALAEMAEAVLRDQKKIRPCAAYLDGEFGHSGHYLGVPVLLGSGGAERVIELELEPDERAALDRSAASVRELVRELDLPSLQ